MARAARPISLTAAVGQAAEVSRPLTFPHRARCKWSGPANLRFSAGGAISGNAGASKSEEDPAQMPNSVSIGSSKAGDGNAIFANNGEEKVLDALAKSGSLTVIFRFNGGTARPSRRSKVTSGNVGPIVGIVVAVAFVCALVAESGQSEADFQK